MTRENKLALIVAFALILGVSVLLSDHLSSARTTEPGTVHETSRLPSVPNRPIRTLDDVVRDARLGGGPSEAAPFSPGAGASQPVNLAGGPPTSGLPDLPEPTLIGDFLSMIGNAPAAMGIEGSVRDPLGSSDASDDALVVLNQGRATREPANQPAAANAGEPALTEPVRHHAVRQGESLYAIAARYYGNGNLWRDLARHNPGRVKPDGTVNQGVSLRIPARVDLTGRPTPAAQTPTATTPTVTPTPEPRQTPPAAPSQPARPRTYTVASGDTLGEISMETLGTSRRWREIYELNRDRIPDPDNVRSGLVLKIPS